MFVLSIIFILLALFIVWYLIKYTIWKIRALSMTANIPGPKTWPLIGNALIFARIKTLEEMFDTATKIFNENCDPNNKIVKIWMGPKLIVLVANPKYIEIILSSQDTLQKDSLYQILEIVISGLISSSGRKWHELRKPLDKLLSKKNIESNLQLFHDSALKLCKVLSKFSDSGEVFNLRHYASNYAIDILSASTFGYNLNEIENERYNVSETFRPIFELILKLMIQLPYNLSLPFAKLTRTGKLATKMAGKVWKLSNELLKARINNTTLKEDPYNYEPEFYSDIILHISDKYKLPSEECTKIASEFLLAGYDTPAIIISYTLLMLAIFPEHQDAVYKEQIEILGEDIEVAPTWEQLSQMTYLTRVIKEVLRHYSPIIVLRELKREVDLGEYKLPKGSSAGVMFHTLHRDKKYWSHPNEFYPDHFLPEEVDKRPTGAYIPFSYGPRSCPGTVYAMATIRTVISTIIRKYQFESDLKFEQFIYQYFLVLELSQGYMVKIKKRNSSSNLL